MKKSIFALCVFAMSMGFAKAQEVTPITEGEYVTKTYNSQRIDTKATGGGLLVKMITNAIMNKMVDNNPMFYSGYNDIKTVFKGDKVCTTHSFDKRVEIVTVDNDIRKTVVYYPSINKGYFFHEPVANDTVNDYIPEGGKVEKTGKTMEVNGYMCDLYSVKFYKDTTDQGMRNVINFKGDFAICSDPSLPNADREVMQGVKGVPMKSTMETVSQSTSPAVNVDMRIYVVCLDYQFNQRTVDDSEFEVPASVKLVDIGQKPKEMMKIIKENKKYLEKNNLWIEVKQEDEKIYDNLEEDWDY